MARLVTAVDGLPAGGDPCQRQEQLVAKAVKAAIKLDDKAPELSMTVYRRITE